MIVPKTIALPLGYIPESFSLYAAFFSEKKASTKTSAKIINEKAEIYDPHEAILLNT